MDVLFILLYIWCLTTTEAQQGSGRSPLGIKLDSTLKQSSLCPGDIFTIFTCTASGTDLVWIIGGRELAFNRNAYEGLIRRDPGGDLALLRSIENATENGHAIRSSVLTVSAQPLATEMLSIKCYNGSIHVAKEIQYLPRPADPPASPEIYVTVDNKSIFANISWTAPINNRDLDYYAISVDDGLPILTKNTSILLNLSSSNSQHFFSLRAVDRCGQQGSTANTTIPSGLVLTVNNNGVKKDCASCLLLVILMFLYVLSSTI